MRTRTLVLLSVCCLVLAGSQVWPTVAAGSVARSPDLAGRETYSVYIPLLVSRYPAPSVPYVRDTILLPQGSHPHGIALDSENDRAFVGNHLANTVTVLDIARMDIVSTIALPGADGPNGVAYNAATDRVYVANRNTHNLSIVDATAGVVVDTLGVGQLPNGVAVQGDWGYVANFGSGSVTVLDAQHDAIVKTIGVGAEPSLLAENAETDTVYLASHGGDRIHYLRHGADVNTHLDIEAPYGLGFDPVSYRLYAANRGKLQVTLIDVNPNLPGGVIPLAREPFLVDVNPRTGHVFVVCGDRVLVYDRRDNGLISTLLVGGGAEEGIAVDPKRNRIYVTNGDADTVTVIQDAPTGELAFVSAQDADQSLVLIDDRGVHRRRLLAASNIQAPSWRPQPTDRPTDGWRLLFAAADVASYQGWDIWTVEPGGQNLVNLTRPSLDPVPGDYEDVEPAWSPDGAHIAWRRDRHIWLMDSDGADKRDLTPGFAAWTPQWSPDGQWIAFIGARDVGREADVFIVSVDGSQLHNVTDDADHGVLRANWSPMGRALAFEMTRDGSWEIYRADVSSPAHPLITRLTSDPARDRFPAWSPDGARVAFISDRTGEDGVYVMNADGSAQRRLGNRSLVRPPLAWSPDGHYLAFHSGPFEAGQLCVLDVATGKSVTLVEGLIGYSQPDWRPDPWRDW